ncbi:MAG: glycoside hydrolase family 5 protein [Treponema sp.]|jgi:endoglucanase|nr:glycoside hydrolase family 5 protein [Treponema sp.]
MTEKLVCKTPFSRGFNFSRWFEARTIDALRFNMFAKKDFENVKSIGVDHIRVPIRAHDLVIDAEYTLHPLLLTYFDQAVDWAEELGLYLLLDNHTFNTLLSDGKNERLEFALCKTWAQLAEHYKNRGDRLIFEVFNEPHGITGEAWGAIQRHVIEVIRAIDAERTIIVGGVHYNSIEELKTIPEYPDKNLIYTFHYYDPHVFTHQGAPWDAIPLTSLKGMPFPWDSPRMPPLPDDLKGTYYEKVFAEYNVLSSRETMASSLSEAVAFANKRQVPVFCGEFGVFMRNCIREDRIRWHELTLELFRERDIGWTIWDWYGDFGVFKKGKDRNFKTDLDPDIIKALGLAMPV